MTASALLLTEFGEATIASLIVEGESGELVVLFVEFGVCLDESSCKQARLLNIVVVVVVDVSVGPHLNIKMKLIVIKLKFWN